MGFLTLLAGGPCLPRAAAAGLASSTPAEEARAIVEALVSCGTRHSLSSWTDTRRGIGCGRDAVAKTLGEMANAPAPPRRVTLGGAVTDSAKIFLEGERDAEQASYEILWRETTEARWSVLRTVDALPSSSFTENPASVLSSISTDDHYFAARSVGKNGRRSIAVPAVAAPRRSKP